MKNTKGITLIALIITIIVMLILVTVTITTAVNGGLFGFAKKAAERTEQEAIREQLQAELTGYYIERYVNNNERDLEEFLVEAFGNNITAFSNDYSGDWNGVKKSSLLYFNCKGDSKYYGFSIDVNTLEIACLDKPIGIFELITNTTDLEEGKEYIIASAPIENKYVPGKSVYVLDKLNIPENGIVNRNNKLYTIDTDSNTIIYNGDYALTLERKNGSYIFYDSKNEKYLNVTSVADNYLGIGKDDEYSKFSISFKNDEAQITFSGKSTNNIIRNNGWYTSCYTSGKNPVYLYKKVGIYEPTRLDTPTATSISGNTEVTLEWETVEGATSYSLLWKNEEGVEEKIDNITSCTYTKSGLTNGSSYYYRIKAYDTVSNKESMWSSEKIVMPMGDGEFGLVTKTSDLENEKKYLIIVYKAENEGYYTIDNYDSSRDTNNRTAKSIGQISDGIDKINGKDYRVELEETGTGNWYIKDSGGYLTATEATAKNRLQTVSIPNTWSEFSISIDEANGNATITCTGKTARNIMKFNYNNGAPVFACYANTFDAQGYNIQLYTYKEN